MYTKLLAKILEQYATIFDVDLTNVPVPIPEAMPIVSQPIESGLRPESPDLADDDRTVLAEYYEYAMNNPDLSLKSVEKIFPSVLEQPEAYTLPEGVKYTDMTIYKPLYELSKSDLTIRHILVIQMTNHELVANYDIEAMEPEDVIRIRQELMISNFKLLLKKDRENG
jgi:hypothetical protein